MDVTNRIAKSGLVVGRFLLQRTPRTKARLLALTRQLVPPVRQEGFLSHRTKTTPDAIELLRQSDEVAAWESPPAFSVIVPTYNTNLGFLGEALDSLRAQSYPHWQAIVVDDCSPRAEVRELISEYAARDSRIAPLFLTENRMIAGATNAGVATASNEWVGFLDHDDVLSPDALFHYAKEIRDFPEADILYCDEDFVDDSRANHFGPWFKPDWNPDFLHSVNYITHFTVMRSTLFRKVGGLRDEVNGAQDWDLLLRAASVTQNVRHIPRLLYSWRSHSESTAESTGNKPYVIESQRRAIEEDLTRKGYPDAIVGRDPDWEGYWQVRYPLRGHPLVSIIIPTKDQRELIQRCVDSIRRITSYRNFEIVLVDTGSTDRKVLDWYTWLQQHDPQARVVSWPEQPFSYSRACNFGATQAKGEILVMLNNDTEVLHPTWLASLAADAQRPEVGAVGPLLLYPGRERVQHAGVGVGLGGLAANLLQMERLFDVATRTQHLMLYNRRNVSAVTGACLAIRASLFQESGGFAEEFSVTYNDVDLCLRLLELGHKNVYLPFVQLIHHESVSLGRPDEDIRDKDEVLAARALFRERWGRYIKHDPGMNPNIDKRDAHYHVLP